MQGYDMEAQSITEMYDFKGKAAIVTGGAMGIGEAIVLRLAEAGASVMIADISLEVANKVVERIKSMGGKAAAIYADAGNSAQDQCQCHCSRRHPDPRRAGSISSHFERCQYALRGTYEGIHCQNSAWTYGGA